MDPAIYSIKVPLSPRFASFYIYGLTYDFPRCSVCDGCDFDPPYIEGEWEDGCDAVGDFTFAYGFVVTKVAIADALLAEFPGFLKGEVRMDDDPVQHRPKKGKAKARVYLPYVGPPLCFIRPSTVLPVASKSTVEVESHCEVCGHTVYAKVLGIERREGSKLVKRRPGMGLVFDKKLLKREMIFGAKDLGFVLCTRGIKDFVTANGYQNVEFREVGTLG